MYQWLHNWAEYYAWVADGLHPRQPDGINPEAVPLLVEACKSALLREDIADCELGDQIRDALLVAGPAALAEARA
jgi:hypothetical protein